MAIVTCKSLAGSVGRAASNRRDDVRLLQYLLNCVPVRRGGPTRELVIDGVCGARTVHAITVFQRAPHRGRTGRIEPGGRVFHALAAFDPFPSQPVPPGYRDESPGKPATPMSTARRLRASVNRRQVQRMATVARVRRPAETTAFVREVVLPGGPAARPLLDPAACEFALRCARSPIHRWGVFAGEPIPAGRRVIEYTGERITPTEAARRSVRAQLYLFALTPAQQIDGAVRGSGAEYINHSCEPNLRASVSSRRLFLVGLRPISAGEELLLDYRIDSDGPRMPCHCGAASCRGFLNAQR